MKAAPDEIKEWKRAISVKFDNLLLKETRNLVIGAMTNKFKSLPTYIVLKIKRDKLGNPLKLKARVVAGGNSHVLGKDFDTLYAPVGDFAAFTNTLYFSIKRMSASSGRRKSCISQW